MLFLIEYDRGSGCIVRIQRFDDSEKARAGESRLELELRLNLEGIEHEVVLLEAANDEALRRTHRRYFENLEELTTVPAD